LKKEIKEDTRTWKNLPCSWISRIIIVEMVILLKATYGSSPMPIKIPKSFFTEIEKLIPKFI
jgi:hypothetical protein